MHASFSCFVIGEGTLPIQCITILQQYGVTVQGVISPDAHVQRWAATHHIPHSLSTVDLTIMLQQQTFDYLFSIVNSFLLPPALLALPRRMAINYHDALLPTYAGSHATSWAILHQETMHGVTWHTMTERVDAGDILKQHTVPIAPDETALSLNLKCYDAAIASFTELVAALVSGQIRPRKQNLRKRRFFARHTRPAAACLFDWGWHSTRIDALVRALQFGPAPNPLGIARFLVEQQALAVTAMAVAPTSSQVNPGTIISITPDEIQVATGGQDIYLRGVQTVTGQPLPLPDFVRQFGLHPGYQFSELDAVTSNRITTLDQQVSRYESFWVRRLADLQPLTLPYLMAYNQPDAVSVNLMPTTALATQSLILTPADISLVHMPGHTLCDWLLTACLAYLARLSGMARFDLGLNALEISGDSAGLESLFAAFVPLRIELDLSQSFTLAYEAVQQQLTLTRKHQTYVRDVVVRYPELHALLGTMSDFAVNIALVERLDIDLLVPAGTLTLLIADEGCQWIYHPQLFDSSDIQRTLHHFHAFLRGIIADPDTPLAMVSLLTETEQQQMLLEWNKTTANYLRSQCIHQIIEAQVARTPNAIAVVAEERQLTYDELNQRANQLAQQLRAVGVGPDVLVGLYVERSLEMAVGLLGILKAGGAYVPLDPAYPRARLISMLEDARIAVVVTQTHLHAQFPRTTAHLVDLELDLTTPLLSRIKNPISGVYPDNLAYVIYTSGSTGRPNGVQVPHRALVNHSSFVARHFDIQSRDRMLQFASINFDASAEEIFPCWLRGATLVLRTEEMLSSFQRFHQAISQQQITLLDLPTSFWHAWVAELERTRLPIPPQLRLVIVGGEQARIEDYRIWRGHAGSGVRWSNSYGPTEATIIATVWSDENDVESYPMARSVPIGRPLDNVQIYLLDRYLQPVPVGVPGEICIGGDGLARGYLHRPDLTASKFIPHPFHGRPGARLYRTGDVARYLPDGTLEFLGRIDDQVKIRGFRVELAEIEALLRQHPAVQETVVLVREDQPGDRRLLAYIVTKPQAVRFKEQVTGGWQQSAADIRTDTAALNSDLRAFLRMKLPEYMLPSECIFLDDLPLTPSGKLDRHALLRLHPARESNRAYVAPRSAVEALLADIWGEVLRVTPVGIDDDFFALGGHSLEAMQIVGKCAPHFNQALSIRDIFLHPTIAGFAQLLEQRAATPPGDPVPQQMRTSTYAPNSPRAVPGELLRLERRSLLDLFADGGVAPVEAATLATMPPVELPLALLAQNGVGHNEMIHQWYNNQPVFHQLLETNLGRIAYIMLPQFDAQVYREQLDLLQSIRHGLEVAQRLGARVVSLAGLLPSATGYGQAITAALGAQADLPRVSTGHATTTATVVLTINQILAESGRNLERERVGVLGLGSIGMASLRLMLRCLPHPREIILCDLYSKQHVLEQIKQELMDSGFRGDVRMVHSRGMVPDAFYTATLIIGATNVPDILDITRVLPGTLIVDDSAPHCFSPEQAIQRFETRQDILFTEGGVLHSSHAIKATRFLPPMAENLPAFQLAFTYYNPFEITGCVLSGLLSARFAGLQPTLGYVDTETCFQHYTMLHQLSFRGANLHCENYILPHQLIQSFRQRFSS